jgi:hypothetical protein
LGGDCLREPPAFERTIGIVSPADREHAVVALDDQCVE